MLEIRFLGQFLVRLDGNTVEIPSRPAQSLLAYLALNAGVSYRREKLAGMIWPDSSETNARTYLRHALWSLRKELDPDPESREPHLLADKIVITFNRASDYWLDVEQIEHRDRQEVSPEAYMASLAVYGGELLPGFYDDWVTLERERLRVAFDQKVHSLLEVLTKETRWKEARDWGERWIALGQAPEPAYRVLMNAYAGLGDLSGVATVYQRCIDTLQEDLGVDPSTLTVHTYEWLIGGGQPPAPSQPMGSQARTAEAGTAVGSMLRRWHEEGVKLLDLADLAVVYASRESLQLTPPDVQLLIRSALQHDVDIDPWLGRAGSPEVAAQALFQVYQDYPKAQVRRRIVEGLEGLEGEAISRTILSIAAHEDNPAIRAKAALAAADRGHRDEILKTLLTEVNQSGDPAALSAFVAIIDEYDLPDDLGPYPRVPVFLALLMRRWRDRRPQILDQTLRAGLGGALGAGLVGSAGPLFVALAFPAAFQETRALISLPGWAFSAALAGLVWGGAQGAATGFAVGFADALWRGRDAVRWRSFLGTLAGLVHGGFLVAFSMMGLLTPLAPMAVYIPVQIVFGLARGLALTLVVPQLGKTAPLRRQVGRGLLAGIVIAALTVGYVFAIYLDQAVVSLLPNLTAAFVFPLGLALALSDLGLRIRRSSRLEGALESS